MDPVGAIISGSCGGRAGSLTDHGGVKPTSYRIGQLPGTGEAAQRRLLDPAPVMFDQVEEYAAHTSPSPSSMSTMVGAASTPSPRISTCVPLAGGVASRTLDWPLVPGVGSIRAIVALLAIMRPRSVG